MHALSKRKHAEALLIQARDNYKSIKYYYPHTNSYLQWVGETLSTVTIKSLMRGDPDKTMGNNGLDDKEMEEPYSDEAERRTVVGLS